VNETVSNPGGGMVGRIAADQGNGMKWRVMVELTGSDGTVPGARAAPGNWNRVPVSTTCLADREIPAGSALIIRITTGRSGCLPCG
jgi:hypothetical protein